MKKALLIVLVLSVSGCAVVDGLLATPRAKRIKAAIETKRQAAFRAGEIRGVQIFYDQVGEGKLYPKLTVRELQVALSDRIEHVADPGYDVSMADLRLYLILIDYKVPPGDASEAKGELNYILGGDPLLGANYASIEDRAVIQSYYSGFFRGIRRAMADLDRAAGLVIDMENIELPVRLIIKSDEGTGTVSW